MKVHVLVGMALAATPLVAPEAMPVSIFLAKADGLKSKGALALFSGDLKYLTKQLKSDAALLKAENQAAVAAGRPKNYCAPAGGIKLKNDEVVAVMQSVPAAQRATTDTKDALRAYFARRFPCRAS